jgi:amino acid transporter
MKRNVIVFGLISGVIVSTLMMISVILCDNEQSFDAGMVVGYTAMILSFAFIYVGIKNYRDKYNHGMITLRKAFTIGLYITLIASTLYVVIWAIVYNFYMPDFFEKYIAHVLRGMKEDGETLAAINKKMASLAVDRERYKSPFFFTLYTYAEIVPVGLFVSLISALILKRGQKQDMKRDYAMAHS